MAQAIANGSFLHALYRNMKQLTRFFSNGRPEVTLSLIAWVASIVLFFGEFVILLHNAGSFPPRVIVLATIFFGIGSFILLLVSLSTRLSSIPKPRKLSLILSLLLIVLLSSTGISFAMTASDRIPIEPTPIIPTPVSLEAVVSPTPTPKSTTVYVAPAPVIVEPQPSDMVTCNSTTCGKTLITRSACQAAVCCEVGNGWYWYSSSSRCSDTQNAYWKTYYDILYGNTSAQAPVLSTPIQADYITDYTSLLDNFKKQNAADAASLQKQLDTIYNGTMQNINNDINSVKASLTPAPVQYTTWGEYYADHPHEIMQHNPSDLFGN